MGDVDWPTWAELIEARVRIAPAKIEIQTYESLIRRAFGECGVKPPLPVEVEPGDLLATAT